jgi:lipoprotein-anchoring transpeptidase ErfK/SrfK
LYKDGELVAEYPCCTGKDGDTPEGVYEINSKVVDPTWYWEGKAIPPGPDNGLGTRFMGINKPSYGIHGTNEPDSIGYSLSHGCVRMRNEDVEKLYELVDIGTAVVIGP